MTIEYAATDLCDAALGGPIRIHNGHFTDSQGRTLSLRGLNVSGASKLPTKPNGLSHLTEGFYAQHRAVTFIGRPFPLEDADLHFRRLSAWGLPLIRLLVTWESLAHAGPDPEDIDEEYIAYLKSIMELMPKYGLKCFICAHQDVWSRFSGGSGAPGWTFEAAGLDIQAFTETGAAYVHGQDELRPVNPREPRGPFVWPSGYQKLAASTMSTLFWAGEAMAPKLRSRRKRMDGEGGEEVSVQAILQDSMIEAFGRLSDEVGDLEACLGFEPMNEPHRGLVNLHDFHGWNYDTDLHIGHYPSLAQALALGSGYAQDVPFYVKSWPFPTRVSHRSRVDPKGRSAWLPADRIEAVLDRPRGLGQCVWRAHGVWDWDENRQVARILDKNYFDFDHRLGREGQRIEWYRDCYATFIEKFTRRVSQRHPHHLSFIEPIPNEFMPPWPEDPGIKAEEQNYATQTRIPIGHPPNLVYAPHFYDLNVLFSKMHSWMSVNVQGLSRGMFALRALYFGVRGLKANYTHQIANLVRHGNESLGSNVPTVIGEVGIPWDINNANAYKTGDYDIQRSLMDALITAMERAGAGFTLWNYNPDNTREHGDGWNKEDFSVINLESAEGAPHPDHRNARWESDELYRGGRALDVIIRPYAVKIAGEPKFSSWDHRTLRFEFRWTVDPRHFDKEKPFETAIFLPNYHYAGHELVVESDEGEWEHDADKQTLVIRTAPLATGRISKNRVVIRIRDEAEHLRGRVLPRGKAFPPSLPRSLVPVSVEMWSETFDLEWTYLFGILALAIALFVSALRM